MPGTGLLCHLTGILKPQKWLLLPFLKLGMHRAEWRVSFKALPSYHPQHKAGQSALRNYFFELPVIVNHSKMGDVSGGGGCSTLC